jgi:CRP/FNR family transcriptional activator FtrB
MTEPSRLVLDDLPLFENLDEGLRARVADISKAVELPPGAVLFRPGEPAASVYVIQEGMVAVNAVGADGKTTLYDVYSNRGEAFPLATSLIPEVQVAEARTLRASRLVVIDAAALRNLAASEPALAMALAQTVSRQLRHMLNQIADLKLRSATQRLAGYLVKLLHEDGGGSSATDVRLPYDKRLLAARLGTRPEHLSRAFATLRGYGVRTRGSQVSITDPSRLSTFASLDTGRPASPPPRAATTRRAPAMRAAARG